MTDVVTWGAVAIAIGSLLSILKFYGSASDRIAKTEASAKSASETAQEAKKDAHEASEKLAILAASFSLYREQIAREYIHREVMREVEERLTQAIDRLGDRLDRVLERSEREHKN
jgi:biopolymer transport protein ExbB/TolQ